MIMRFPQSIFKTTPFSKDSNTQKTKLSDAFNKPIIDWDNSTCAEARTAVSESISSMIQVEFTFHGRKVPIRLVARSVGRFPPQAKGLLAIPFPSRKSSKNEWYISI